MAEKATADPEGETDETGEQQGGLLEQAGDNETEVPEETGDGEQESEEQQEDTETYVPSGELTQEQVESLPDHMVNDDGTVNAEELVKQNLGFREKASDGTLEEALEFYEEHQGEMDEDEGESEEDETEETQRDIPESPDEYEIKLETEDGEEVETDEEVSSIIKEAAHQSELSQDQLNTFVNNFESMFQENFTKDMDPDEELGKISDDPQEAQKVVNEVNNKLDAMHQRGYLTEDEYQEAKIMGGTAEGVSVFRKFMAKIDEFDDIPTGQESVGGESVDEVQSELDELMQHDAYFDPSHPEHERVNKEAEQLRQRKRELQSQ